MTAVRMRTTIAVALEHLEEFRVLLGEALAESLSEVADPTNGTQGYAAYLNEETGQLVLFEHHDSYNALLAHLDTDPARRARMQKMCTSGGATEIYGSAPPELIELLTNIGVSPVIYPTTLGVMGPL